MLFAKGNKLAKIVDIEPLGNSAYGQKYIYADYYALFDEDFAKKRKMPERE